MAKPVVLLGAGASIDAGLLDTFSLTEAVYNSLKETPGSNAHIFGFVVAKLLVRNTRKGLSPFNKVNVEDAYDALKRFLIHDDDSLSEFVSSWETFPPAEPFGPSRRAATDKLIRSFHLKRNLNSGPSFSISPDALVESLRVLLDLNEAPLRNPESFLRACVDELARILDPEKPNISYLRNFVKEAHPLVDSIATLNYDLLLERAAEECAVPIDYGLTDWNKSRLVKFSPNHLKLLKIHGSLNWYFRGHDSIDVEPDNKSHRRRAMIFGGQNEKLNPNGPFMTIRSEFQRFVNSTTVLAIIGYSFSDHHLNAIIRSWLSVKRKGKLILVNPTGLDCLNPVLRLDTAGSVADRVEFVEIREPFGKSINKIVDALRTPPKLSK